MCYHVCGIVHVKVTLSVIVEITHVEAGAGFLSRYLSGTLPSVHNHKSI